MARNPKERKSLRIRRRKRTPKSTSRFYLIFGIIVLLSLIVVTTATITLSTGLPTISSHDKIPSIDPVLPFSTPSIVSQGMHQNPGFFDEVQIESILGFLRRVDQLLVRIISFTDRPMSRLQCIRVI